MALLQQIMNIASENYSIVVAVAIVFFVFMLISFCGGEGSKGQPWNLPLIGMLHIFFPISTNIFDNLTKIMEGNGGTFVYKGPWLSGQNMVITCDPSNFQHILSSKFSNYPKGSDTYTLFEPYGKFLFTLDFDEWKSHRKIVNRFVSDQGMQNSQPKINLEIFKNGMIPVLDHASEQGLVLDLKEVSKRLFLDITIMFTTGYNYRSLSIGFQEEPILNAIVDINHGILFRHILPKKIWKLQRWLGIGQEKKVLEASKCIEELISKFHIQTKKEEGKSKDNEFITPTLSLFLPSEDYLKKEFIKATLFASVDTNSVALTWFLWLIQENPIVLIKIRQEIDTELSSKHYNKFEKEFMFVDPKELNKLVYLHAALLEAIRLYPSAPYQCRTCVQTDILPSGHCVKSGTKALLSQYSMARMKSVWGNDCCEYNPDRWIAYKNGRSRILLVSSSKFCTFSSGSRICPGKELGIFRLKSAAATIIHNYDIQILKDHPITPSIEIILEMKYPLHAKINKR